MTIDILLSTYNGERFIDVQIESILKQTYSDWKLIIRDDGSTDQTPEKLRQWQKKHPDKIDLSIEENVGVIGSFNKTFERSKAPYLTFCDQDDVWLPGKLEQGLLLLKKQELEQTPLLVHSDLIVVDESLNTISSSFWRYSYLSGHEKYTAFNRLLVQNVVTGCATLFNRPLALLAFPVPENSPMHDWWFALVASSFGKILSLKEPQILYRQHSSNTLGAQHFSVLNRPNYNLRRALKSARHERKKIDQAAAFLSRYHAKLDLKTIEALQGFIHLREASMTGRIATIIKHKIYKIGWQRNLFHFFLTTKRRTF